MKTPPSRNKSSRDSRADGLGLAVGHPDIIHRQNCRRNEARRVLRWGLLEGMTFQKRALKSDFLRLQQSWLAACSPVDSSGQLLVPSPEAEAAATWYVSMAVLLIAEEREHRLGRSLLQGAPQPDVFFP